MKKLFILIGLTFSLQGCIFVVGAAAGAAGIAVVYDHRKVEQTLKDQNLANTANREIKSVSALRNDSHVEATAFNQILLLTGQTPTAALRQRAENQVKNISGIKRIYNQITIQGPTSSLTRASDAWITTKIRSEMLATEGLKSSSIKIETENGAVYLMGSVTREQADISVDIARQVTGVQKVMKIFQYRD